MKLLVVHISDIHLCKSNEATAMKMAGMVGAGCRSTVVQSGVQELLVFLTGDFASTGEAENLALIPGFMNALDLGLRQHNLPITYFAIPGNHDCNLTGDQTARNAVIKSVTAENMHSESVVEIGSSVHREFIETLKKVSPQVVSMKDHRVLYHDHTIDFGRHKIEVRLLNSAWTSSRNETQGTLIPPKVVPGIAEDPQCRLRIVAMHHPFSWFRQDLQRDYRGRIEQASNIILSGHEHIPDEYTKTKIAGAHIAYSEGVIFTASSDKATGGFKGLVLDTEAKTVQFMSGTWHSKSQLFEVVNHPDLLDVGGVTRLGATPLRLRKEFSRQLEEIAIPVTHPRAAQVRRADLFVPPSMKWLTQKGKLSEMAIVRGEDVPHFLMKHHKSILFGPDQAGKSSLAKHILIELADQGIVTLLLSATIINSSSEKTLKSILDAQILEQFEVATSEEFWQLGRERAAIIVDDFHRLTLSSKRRLAVLEFLEKSAINTILITGDDINLAEFNMEEESPSLLSYEQLEVLPLGRVARAKFARKWAQLGRGDDQSELVVTESEKLERVMQESFRKNLLPSFPYVILALLQQIEARSLSVVEDSSVGHLTHAVITARLSKITSPAVNLNALFTHLAGSAFKMFLSGANGVRQEALNEWHKEYCERYDITPDLDRLISDYERAGMWELRGSSYLFRHKYAYCFFVAWHIHQNIDQSDVQAHVLKMAAETHLDDTATSLLYLAHLVPGGRFVLPAVLKSAEGTLDKYGPATLGTDVDFLKKLAFEGSSLKLHDESKEDRLQRRREALDKLEQNGSAPAEETCSSSDAPVATPNESSPSVITSESEFASAFRLIQVLGQILRNGAGSLEASIKNSIATGACNLALRSESAALNCLNDYSTELFQHFRKVLEREDPLAGEEDLQRRSIKGVYGLALISTLGIIRHLSRAIGSRVLERTFERVTSADNTLAWRLIGLAIKLDYGSGFPEDVVRGLAEATKHNRFAHEILRHLVWEHFYLNEVKFDIRQSCAALLDIEINARMLTIAKREHQK